MDQIKWEMSEKIRQEWSDLVREKNIITGLRYPTENHKKRLFWINSRLNELRLVFD